MKSKLDEIFEAYGVLSYEDSKLKYDLGEHKEFDEENYVSKKDFSNEVKKNNFRDYQQRLMHTYNYNALGRYNAGYPMDDTKARGGALKKPGQFHNSFQEIIKEQ